MRRATQNRCFMVIGLACGLFSIYLLGQLFYDSSDSTASYILPNGQTVQMTEDFVKQRQFHTRMMGQYGDAVVEAGKPGCKMPDLKLRDPTFNEYFSKNVTKDCKTLDWVYAWSGVLHFEPEIVKLIGAFKCACVPVMRVDDFRNRKGVSYQCTDGSQLKTDFTHVSCKFGNDEFKTVVSTIVKTDEIIGRVSKHSADIKEHLNVLMLGLDSVSRLAMIRKMPKTVKRFTELGGQFLERYNIVGDGTPQALLPMLCGKTEIELPNTRKRDFPKSQFCDVYPFIWNDFKQKGYVTMEAEDNVDYGTYQYRLNGFKEQPTDHYQRNYFIESDNGDGMIDCIKGKPRFKVHFNYSLDFFETYKDEKKFAFSISDLCHDEINACGAADDYFVWFLTELKIKGHLDNTLLILFADHGARFSTSFTSFRNTQQGKLEERLPAYGVLLPHWFKTKYPIAYKNFRVNAKERLLTPFSIYGSLRRVVDNSFDKVVESIGVSNSRELSIFDAVPIERSCKDADVEPHWCACLDWKDVPFDDAILQSVVASFIGALNDELKSAKDLCAQLRLKTLLGAQKYSPNKAVMQFKKAKDLDGLIGDFSDQTTVDVVLYQLKIQTAPGDAIYEASVAWHVTEGRAEVDLRGTSTLTKYSDNAKCIMNSGTLSYMRYYCVCKP